MPSEPVTSSAGWRVMAGKRLLLLGACLLGLAVNGFLKFPALPHILGGDNDFLSFYAGAHLAGGSQLYNPEATTRIQASLWETPRFLPFVRFPVYAAAIAPLRWFSYQHAYWIWQSVCAGAMVLFVCYWPGPSKWTSALAVCWSIPLLDCFIMGRDVAVFLLALALATRLLLRGRPFTGGCILSLCLIKYNLFLTLPLLIVGKRQWRMGGGVASGGAALMALSFAVGGWRWPWQYAAVLGLKTTTPSYSGMPNLHGLFSGVPQAVILEIAGTLAVLAATWMVIRRGDLARAIAAMLVSGLLVSYHAFLGDALILMPACLLLLTGAASAMPRRVIALFLLSPLAYLPFLLPTMPLPPAAVVLLPLLVMAREAGAGQSPTV